MTKKHSTKKALVASLLALVLCFSMLIGTTFAWFTDSVTSANNIIKSGNLDIELEYWDGDSWEDVSGKSDILTNELWEPGVTEVAYLRVANAGSLALKYQLGINIVSEADGVNKAGEAFKLSDYIMFGVIEDIDADATTKAPATYADRDSAVAAVEDAKKISVGYNPEVCSMSACQERYLALVVYMPTTVGNEANHDGTTVPEIDLGISIFATQVEAESDSFDNTYDADILIPDPEYGLKVETGDIIVTVPAEAFANGASRPQISEPVIEKIIPTSVEEKVEYKLSFDITIDGLVENNTEPCRVVYHIDPELLPFVSGVEEVYHNGVKVDDPVFDATAGTVTFYTTSFSPFEIILKTDYVMIPESYTNDEAVAMLKNAASKGGKIDGNGKVIDVGATASRGALDITANASFANMTIKGTGSSTVNPVVMIDGRNQTVRLTNVVVQNTSNGCSLSLSTNGATSQIFENCTFKGKAWLMGSNATFVKCSFNKNNNMAAVKNFTFTECQFTYNSAITLDSKATNLLVEKCTFSGSAFRLCTSAPQSENVRLINNTYKGTKLVSPDAGVDYDGWKAAGAWIEEGNVK
ncbi:MAG: right-handed parallel beta-helix repeat-containing protein, partial [Clostridia bacterium]|nr:right-handed parallel beta-helix repeat-containing protein [Clostridia bacterium]